MLSGNLHFLRLGIALKRKNLHPVQKGLRNRIRAVGRADKQHIRQIVGYVHIMIGKVIVLLRIQHLQKRAGRITVEGLCQLIHLIQYHNRIGNAAPFHAFHNPAWHRADISAPVSAYLCLIANAAQTDSYIFSAKRLRYTLSDAGLSSSGRAHEQQDRARLLFLQPHRGDLLNHAPLNPFQPIVILIQDPFCPVQIYGPKSLLLPGKPRHKVQVIVKHSVLMAVLALLLHAV